jgi:hypothetical protein
MSEIESSNITAWLLASNWGDISELNNRTPNCNIAEQSAYNNYNKLKYFHISFYFHNKRKLGGMLFEEKVQFDSAVATGFLGGVRNIR